MQQKCTLQGYHTNFVIRGFFRLGWWTIYHDLYSIIEINGGDNKGLDPFVLENRGMKGSF